jgi:hypothetical protein
MTALVALYWLLTAVAGAAVASLLRIPLRFEERVAIAVVAGVAGGAVATFFSTLVAGITSGAVLAGPLLLGLVVGGIVVAMGDPLRPWRDSWTELRARRRTRELAVIAAVTLLSAAGAAVLFAHTLFVGEGGAIDAGFSTVWADWSLHATTASSFASGHNLPPQNPVFSGTALRYPFLPDFQSGMLMTLGSSVEAALAVPGALLMVAATVLVVSLTRRLTGSTTAGVVAIAVCLVGGGLGAAGLWWDGCSRAGMEAAQCSPGTALLHPGTVVAVVRHIPDTIASQPRPYDGLQAASQQQPFGNLQWYTPLLAWWLPQRSFLFGFAMTVAVLLLLVATVREPGRAWPAFLVAGTLAGLLPLFHVHSLIALVLALPLVAWRYRRREWWGFAGAAFVVAVPRLVQLALGGHGSPAGPYGSDVFPWFEPGWLSQAASTCTGDQCSIPRFDLTAAGGVQALVTSVRVLVSPSWWAFWIINTGVLLPLCTVLLLASPARRLPGRLGPLAARVRGAVPSEALRWCLPFMVVFALANVVVFQTWDWDNTKLLVYWQLAAGILAGAWLVGWWRRGRWRALASGATLATLLGTGAVVMLQFLPGLHGPGSPPPLRDGSGRSIPQYPFVWASRDDLALAATVSASTDPHAVFLTGGKPNDPVLTLGGRSAVLGYGGWLWSYGIDFGTRPADVATMYRGCADDQTECPVPGLLRRYHVSYVELGSWERDSGHGLAPREAWWSAHFPVLTRAGNTVIYDVRRA